MIALVTFGTCTINANQAGNVIYGAAPQVSRTFRIACGAVGQSGPAGGTVFHVDMTRPPGSQCFEAAPADWQTPETKGSGDPQLQWAPIDGPCYSTDITAAQATAIGTGEANMTAIITNASCDSATEAPAAWAALQYAGGGQTDWFMASKDELNQLYENRAVVPGIETDPGNEPFYWSSSQSADDPESTWFQYFDYFFQGISTKNDFIQRIRPVRAY
ncbi:MAG: DUF1566 domain-containing protein [Actinomycetes bacterium]